MDNYLFKHQKLSLVEPVTQILMHLVFDLELHEILCLVMSEKIIIQKQMLYNCLAGKHYENIFNASHLTFLVLP